MNSSGRRIGHGSADSPGINSGRATGMNADAPDHEQQHQADRERHVALASSASFGRNGAPAAPPSRSRPIAYGRSRATSRGQPEGDRRRDDEVRHHREQHQPAAAERATMSRDAQPQPGRAMQVTTKTRTASFDNDLEALFQGTL